MKRTILQVAAITLASLATSASSIARPGSTGPLVPLAPGKPLPIYTHNWIGGVSCSRIPYNCQYIVIEGQLGSRIGVNRSETLINHPINW